MLTVLKPHGSVVICTHKNSHTKTLLFGGGRWGYRVKAWGRVGSARLGRKEINNK